MGWCRNTPPLLALVEAFWLMGVVFVLMIPFLPLLQCTKRKPAPGLRTPRDPRSCCAAQNCRYLSNRSRRKNITWPCTGTPQFCGASLSHLIP